MFCALVALVELIDVGSSEMPDEKDISCDVSGEEDHATEGLKTDCQLWNMQSRCMTRGKRGRIRICMLEAMN